MTPLLRKKVEGGAIFLDFPPGDSYYRRQKYEIIVVFG